MRKKTTLHLLVAALLIMVVLGCIGAIAYISGTSCYNSQLPDNESNSGKFIWENLSHQFFTTF